MNASTWPGDGRIPNRDSAIHSNTKANARIANLLFRKLILNRIKVLEILKNEIKTKVNFSGKVTGKQLNGTELRVVTTEINGPKFCKSTLCVVTCVLSLL